MCKVIVFAGTTEGRQIAEFLDRKQVKSYICVATEYGEEMLPKSQFLEISHERLNQEQMRELFLKKSPLLVLDATHPYAAKVTENIRAACKDAGISYKRILRENEGSEAICNAIYVDNTEEAAAYLSGTKGNVLVTTGSKEAQKYTVIPEYEKRIFLRILSVPDAVKDCAELGFEGRNLICMQGPFSRELNRAMLLQYECKYLVTKMSGNAGGFLEKVQAAEDCGCKLILIGRPLSEEGISVKEAKRLLCRELSLEGKPEIALVGIGMGSGGTRTGEAESALENADLLIGARRMVQACRKEKQDILEEYDSQKIADYIKMHPEYEKIAIALSGDVGFYSGAKKLSEILEGSIRLIPGISSVVYFMSRIQQSWEDALLVSAHGKEANLIPLIRDHKKVFAILGNEKNVSQLAKSLLEYGMEETEIFLGEDLSYPEEKITRGRPENFLEYKASSLSVVCVLHKNSDSRSTTHGISDREFIRDKVPMTKEEVRSVSLSKLHLKEDSVCWDVGAGTGSVSVEMALRVPYGKVYAIEKKEAAVELLKKNKRKFAADNLTILEGTAPEVLKSLEAPTHAFIGGTSGNMKEILKCVLEKNSKARIVINCIALESISEALNCLKELPVTDTEVVQLCASRAKEIGAYHLMMGENPIYILSCTGTETSEE